MAIVIKKLEGSLPVSRQSYKEGATYYKDNIVTRYGSAFQCVVESTTTPPATINDSGKVTLGEGWIFFADTSEISNTVAEHTEKITKLDLKVNELEIFKDGPAPIQFTKGYNIDPTTGELEENDRYSVSPVLSAFNGKFVLYLSGTPTTDLGFGFMAYYNFNMVLLGCKRKTIDSDLLASASFVQFSVLGTTDTDLAAYTYSGDTLNASYVSVNPQSFDDTKKESARVNIGAAGEDDAKDYYGRKYSNFSVNDNLINMAITGETVIDLADETYAGAYIKLEKGQSFKISGTIVNAYSFNKKPYVGLAYEGSRINRFYSGNYYKAGEDDKYLFVTIKREQIVNVELFATGIFADKVETAAQNYRYLAFSFIEGFPGMKILGTNDLSHFNLISNPTNEFIPTKNIGLRDPAIIQIDGWYYIAYTNALTITVGNTIGLCRTKDFNTFEELPNLVLAGEGGEDFSKGYCWAPDWFREGNNIYIICGCATDANTQDFLHYIFNFNVETNSVGLGFKTNVTFIDGHIYKQNGLYYMLQSGFTLHRSATLKSNAWEDITTYQKWHYEGEFVIRKDDGNLRIFAQAVPNESDGVTNSHMWYCDGGATLDSNFGDMVEGSGLKRITYDKATEDYAHEILGSTIKEFWHWTIFDRNRWSDNNNNYS